MSDLARVVPNLSGLVEQHGIKHACETGCHHGHGIDNALALVEGEVHSCDIDNHMVRRCERRFSSTAASGRVRLQHALSVDFLKWYCEEGPEGPTLFWIDAHWPKCPVAKEHWTPTYEDVKVLATHRKGLEHDIIVVDDMDIVAKDNPFRGQIHRSEKDLLQASLKDFYALFEGRLHVEVNSWNGPYTALLARPFGEVTSTPSP